MSLKLVRKNRPTYFKNIRYRLKQEDTTRYIMHIYGRISVAFLSNKDKGDAKLQDSLIRTKVVTNIYYDFASSIFSPLYLNLAYVI